MGIIEGEEGSFARLSKSTKTKGCSFAARTRRGKRAWEKLFVSRSLTSCIVWVLVFLRISYIRMREIGKRMPFIKEKTF